MAAMSRPVLVLNGPNLNLLGEREPELYGRITLAQIEAGLAQEAARLGMAIECRQSNHEGDLIDAVQAARGRCAGVIFNPGGLSHTSVALGDACAMLDCPLVEVHISNIHAREPFRHHSFISRHALGVICGLGARGYTLALIALADAQKAAAPLAE